MIKQEDERSAFLSGALALTVSVFVVKLIGYIYKLPLSHVLGDEGMGYFNSAYSVFSFFYMISLGGVPRAVAVCVADARFKCGMSAARRILSLSLKMFLLLGITFALLLMSFSGFFAKIIGNSLAKLSLICIAPSLSFVAAAGVLRGYLNGVGKLRSVALSEILDGVSKFVTGLALALYASRHGYSVYIVSAYTVLGVSIGAFVGALFMLICSKIENIDEKEGQKCDLKENDRDVVRKIFRISAPITLSSAIMGATGIIDLALIMKRLISVGFSEVEAVSLYGNFTTLVIPLLNLISAFVSPLATATMPSVAKQKALNSSDEYYGLVEQIIFLTSFFISPLAFGYCFFADDILLILFNDASARVAAPLLSIASASVIPSALLIVVNAILEASGRYRTPLVSMSVGAAVKLLSAYLLIGRIGIFGAPVSTALCYLTSFLISAVALRTSQSLKRSVVRSAALPFFLAAAILVAARVVYVLIPMGEGNARIFMPFVVLITLIYIGFGWIFMRKRMDFLENYVKIAKKRQSAL